MKRMRLGWTPSGILPRISTAPAFAVILSYTPLSMHTCRGGIIPCVARRCGAWTQDRLFPIEKDPGNLRRVIRLPFYCSIHRSPPFISVFVIHFFSRNFTFCSATSLK